ncbi:MAG: permease prefix domain 1-containing protein [Bacillota bacterium]|nr:permease prefix domain 1-containing protein [Bacillota bacterium]
MFDLESNINAWSNHLRLSGNLKEEDVLELEGHLREEIDELNEKGLVEDEAFLISVKRLGNINNISEEYSKVNTENLWKQLLVDFSDEVENKKNYKDIFIVLIFAFLAGTFAKIPNLFGITIEDIAYFKNLSFYILPMVVLYFGITRNINKKIIGYILGLFFISAVIVNVYPSYTPNHTEVLSSIHLPLMLWLITGVAYMGERWRTSKERMNFIRLTGESIIYGSLILLGSMVLIMFTAIIFETISIDISEKIINNIAIYGGSTAFMLTIYLVEKKKSVVENFAPILAKIFSPLFLITIIVFLIAMLLSGKSPVEDRNFLISFDLMLVLVLGLVLYTISARDIHRKSNIFDYLNVALVTVAILVDGIALTAIILRLSEYGLSPNKLAALGENILLLINLIGLLWLYIKYFKEKISFEKIEIFQTSYLIYYAIWMGVVVFIFPIFFGFK